MPTLDSIVRDARQRRDETEAAVRRADEYLQVIHDDPSVTEQAATAAIARRDNARATHNRAEADLTDLVEQQRDAGRIDALQQRTYPNPNALGGLHRADGVQYGGARTSAAHVYQRGDTAGASWVRDMAAVSLSRAGSTEAMQRLERNNDTVRGELQARALTTVDGAGGDFVPPLWLMNDMIEMTRAGRVTANLLRINPLPGGTDSINLPKIATGTAVAEQATQNVAVQNTDATTATVNSAVTTIAGQQVISVQLLEQSPINMDDVLLRDLLADLAVKTDGFVINNNAANKLGLLNVSGINAVAFTTGAPTAALLYPKLADAVQQISVNRFLPATAIVMHPRRWAWLMASVDTATRPLVVPVANGPQNSFGTSTGTTDVATGLVGTLMGLPVYVDPVIPTNLGAGTNEDRIIVLRTDDSILYEGTPRAEAFRETKADQLSILLRVYNYCAIAASRLPKSISVIAGTGLVTPTF